jgi:hypothetical protein
MEGDKKNSIVVKHAGLEFGFRRDFRGNGYWFCLSSVKSVYGHGIGCTVPRCLWSDIRCSALNQGIFSYDIEIDPPPVIKPSRGSTRSPSRGSVIKSKSRRPAKEAKSDNSIKIFF